MSRQLSVDGLACGADTFRSRTPDDENVCLCDRDVACAAPDDDLNKVKLAGIFDQSNFYWGEELFGMVVDFINDHSDGFHDDIFDDGTLLEFTLADSACNEDKAAQAYGESRADKPHGIVGCRCSSASKSVARIANLDEIPQVSPVASEADLSDDKLYPLFSRTAAPDDSSGQVGAMINMLHLFGWDTVSILSTPTTYARGFAVSFKEAWETEHSSGDEDGGESWTGVVDATDEITLLAADPETGVQHVDPEFVERALQTIARGNSRIILLLAHDHHAFTILKMAHESGLFEDDVVWVGPEGWAATALEDVDLSWAPEVSGYVGLSPLRNRNSDFQDFFERVQAKQKEQGLEPWADLPDYAAEHLVDAILSLTKALSLAPREQRRNATLVTQLLRGLVFDGVSGPVSFSPEGDRLNPQFTVFNLQPNPDGPGNIWEAIGISGPGSATFTSDSPRLCLAGAGCGGMEIIPASTYPIPKEIWALIVIPLVAVLLSFFAFKYYRGKSKRRTLKEKIENELSNIDQIVEDAKKKQEALILQRAAMEGTPDSWSDNADTILVDVPADQGEYWDVAERLRGTMDDAYISKLWRVQSVSLWSYYSFHKDRLAMNGVQANEIRAFHGTSKTDPAIIYKDTQDGFMMQHSRDGFWGRGIYFAENSSYSDAYAYRLTANWSPHVGSLSSERPSAASGEREMFLAKLLVGSSVEMNRDESEDMRQRCHALTVPPVNPATQIRFNTVTGQTGGSKVYIAYENGRAYPEYLIRYYRGERDVTRTRFASRKDATGDPPTPTDTTSNPSSSRSSGQMTPIWEYQDNSGWSAYGPAHQKVIETCFLAHLAGFRETKVQIQTDEWLYEVDVERMKQRNLQHPGHRERDIQRLVGSGTV